MELGARLEEKRKAIEAQKKRIEAIFAKHRQRLGKTAFLQLKKEQEDGDGEEGRQGESKQCRKRIVRGAADTEQHTLFTFSGYSPKWHQGDAEETNC
uniref:Uncharacterized protein n=1 Tax=Sinocyclocheilus anshuiensis TaxID=1608454 RepID=A0A671QZU9_9TELE